MYQQSEIETKDLFFISIVFLQTTYRFSSADKTSTIDDIGAVIFNTFGSESVSNIGGTRQSRMFDRVEFSKFSANAALPNTL